MWLLTHEKSRIETEVASYKERAVFTQYRFQKKKKKSIPELRTPLVHNL